MGGSGPTVASGAEHLLWEMWEEKWGPLCSEAHMGHCGSRDRLSFQLLRRALYYPNWKMVSGRWCNDLWGFRAPNGTQDSLLVRPISKLQLPPK